MEVGTRTSGPSVESSLRTARTEARHEVRSHRWGLALLLAVGVLAFVLRAWYAHAHPWFPWSGGDNTWYSTVGQSFAEGRWGRVRGSSGALLHSARFPPGYPLVLAAGQRLLFWVRPFWAQLWTSVALGTAGAVLTTALAWRLTSSATLRTRVVATAATGLVIACNPLVVGASAALMAEVLVLPLVAGFLLLVDAVTTTPARVRTWVLLGLVVVATAFTRGEGLLLLGVPLVALVIVHRRSRAVRVGVLAVLGGALAVALAWSAVLSSAAGRPVLMSTNSGSVVMGANCPAALHGDGRGSWDSSWDGSCPPPPDDEMSPRLRAALRVLPTSPFGLGPQFGTALEAELSAAQLRTALRRIGDDPGPSISAIPFRWARAIGVLTTAYDSRLTKFEGRDPGLEDTGRLLQKLVVLPLVLLFLVALGARRSRLGIALRDAVHLERLVPAGLLVASWLVMIALTYGSARFRQPVEPVFALVCGLAVATVVGAVAPATGQTRSMTVRMPTPAPRSAKASLISSRGRRAVTRASRSS